MSEVTVLDEFSDFIEETELLGIVIKSYTEVGTVSSAGGKASFTAREIVSIDERKSAYDIVIDIERSNQHPSNGSAKVTFEEMDRIILAVSKLMRGGRHGVTRMSNFEAGITSSDGTFRIVVFNGQNRNVMFLIEAGGVSLFFNDLRKLPEVATCLSDAKAEIERIKL